MAESNVRHGSGACHSGNSDSDDSSPVEILGLDSYLTDNRKKSNDIAIDLSPQRVTQLQLLPFASNSNSSHEQEPEPRVQIPTPEAEIATEILQRTNAPPALSLQAFAVEEADTVESTEISTEAKQVPDQPAPELPESTATTEPSQVSRQQDNRRGALGHKRRKAMPRYCIACGVHVSRAKLKAHCRSRKHIERVFAFQLKKRAGGGDSADKNKMDTKAARKPWRRPRKAVDDRKTPPFVTCEICEVELQRGSIRGHNKSKNHLLLHRLFKQFTSKGNRILRRSTRTTKVKIPS